MLNAQERKELEEVASEKGNDPEPFPFFSVPKLSNRLISDLYKDTMKKGEQTIDLSHLDPKAREAVSKALYEFGVDKTPESKFEEMMMKEFDSFLNQHPETDQMTPSELMDFLQLKPEDKKVVEEDIEQTIAKVEKGLEGVNLQSVLPDAKDSVSDFVSAMEKAVSADPSLATEVDAWLSKARSKMGTDLQSMETLSDEEFAQFALPPLRLRNAMKPFMTEKKRLGDMNLEASSDPRDLFVMKKWCVCWVFQFILLEGCFSSFFWRGVSVHSFRGCFSSFFQRGALIQRDTSSR